MANQELPPDLSADILRAAREALQMRDPAPAEMRRHYEQIQNNRRDYVAVITEGIERQLLNNGLHDLYVVEMRVEIWRTGFSLDELRVEFAVEDRNDYSSRRRRFYLFDIPFGDGMSYIDPDHVVHVCLEHIFRDRNRQRAGQWWHDGGRWRNGGRLWNWNGVPAIAHEFPTEQADKKARELLLSVLDDQAKAGYLANGTIRCRGNETGQEYVIHHASQINIEPIGEMVQAIKSLFSDEKQKSIRNGKTVMACVVCAKRVPIADQMAAQYLLITCNESEFLDKAIWW